VRLRALSLALLTAAPALAEAPTVSLRPPEGRPAVDVTFSTRSYVRGDAFMRMPPPTAPFLSLRPEDRPAVIEALAKRQEIERRAGSVCGDLDIEGEVIGVVEGPGACGIPSAVRVRAVSGVALSRGTLVTCETATALRTWVDRGLRPAVGDLGGGPVSLRVAAGYVCRNRNHDPNARLSEHSFGKAIDISLIRLADGSEISVERDWGRGERGGALLSMWQAACGPFGTVLGPEADAAHRSHFHFDVADYRSGPYCR